MNSKITFKERKRRHTLIPFPEYFVTVIIGETLVAADKLFNKINIYNENYFYKWTTREKMTLNEQRFLCVGMKSAINCVHGRSVNLIVFGPNVPDDYIQEHIAPCVFPILYSTGKGFIMRYDNEKGLIKYE